MAAQPVLQYDVAYPERLSRGLIFIKWLLIIPHAIALAVLAVVAAVIWFLSFFAILITGRYPRGMWDFSLMVLRWAARMNAYYYLQRDEYPPFGDGDYPLQFDLDYPERLSRWKIFIKWLLIIPSYIVYYFLSIVLGIVWIFAWFAILFTGRYPRGMFDFTTGGLRWSYNMAVYMLNLTDAYPPFTTSQMPSPTALSPGGYPSAPAYTGR